MQLLELQPQPTRVAISHSDERIKPCAARVADRVFTAQLADSLIEHNSCSLITLSSTWLDKVKDDIKETGLSVDAVYPHKSGNNI